jgi:hypothetical protein
MSQARRRPAVLLVDARVGLSSVGGFGLFAQQFISKGTPVWEYAPGLDLSLSQAEVDALADRARRAFLHYSCWNSKLGCHILCFDDARYMNHSDDPNTDGRRAIRDIVQGEELTYTYGRRDLTFDFERTLGQAAVPRLAEALKDADQHIRLFAAKTLSKIGVEAGQAVPALSVALTDRDPMIRYYVAKCLSQIGHEARDAVSVLTEAMKDSHPKVRYYSAKALGRIGAAATAAIEALRTALNDRDREVVDAATHALSRIERGR